MTEDTTNEQDDIGTRKGWPPGVRSIDFENLALFGVDGEGGLYFDGKKVEVRKVISLTKCQAIFASLAAIATVVIAAVELLTFLGCGSRICP